MKLEQALVVDDSRLARYTLERLLKELGFQVQSVASGQEALNSIKQNPVDIVFMDFMMPDMDGYATAAAMAQVPQIKDTPVLMCTAQESDDAAEAPRTESANIRGYIPKPPTADAVKQALETIRAQAAAPSPATAPAEASAAAQPATSSSPSVDEERLKRELEQIARHVAEETARQVVDKLLKESMTVLSRQLTPTVVKQTTAHVEEHIHREMDEKIDYHIKASRR
jgi:CheY-like chemotaxis protein